MVINTEPIRQVIEIDIDKNSATKSLDFARDTGKAIDKELQRKLQIDILQAESKVEQLKSQIKDAKKAGEQPFALQLDLKNVQSWLTEAKRQLNNLNNTWETSVSRLQAKFNALGSSISNAFTKVWSILAGAGILSFFQWVVNEATEAARATAQLNAVIKSTGWTVGLTAAEIQNMAVELGKLNWLDNDVVASAQNMLLTFTNIRWQAFEPATQAVIDLATAMNWGIVPASEELAKTAVQVGKALNDPIKGISALQKVGVSFNEVQKEQIKNFVDAWKTAEAQKIILAELNKEFGGSAAAQLDTYWGKINALNLSFNQLKEDIGNALLPVLTKIIGAFLPVIEAVQKLSKENPTLTATLSAVTIWVVALAWAFALLWWPALLVIGWIVAATAAVWALALGIDKLLDPIHRLDWSLTALGKKFNDTLNEATPLKKAVDANRIALENYAAVKLDQSATRAQFNATRKAALDAANALLIALDALIKTAAFQASSKVWKIAWWIGWNLTQWFAWASTSAIQAIRNQQKGIIDGIEQDTFDWVKKLQRAIADIGAPKVFDSGASKKEQQNILQQLDEAKNKLNDTIVWTKDYQDALSKVQELEAQVASEWAQSFWDLSDSVNASVKDIQTGIDSFQKSIDWLKKSIEDIDTQIANLWKDSDKKIAERVSAIDQSVKELQDKINSWQGTAEDQKKLTDLINERAQAFIGLTQEQITALDELIAKQEAYDAATGIEKIKLDTQAKKDALEIEKADKQAQLDSLVAQQISYQAILNQILQAQKLNEFDIANQLIAKRNEVARARAAAGAAAGWVGTGTTTNTNSNSNSINNNNNTIVVNVNWPSPTGVVDAINNNIQ